MVDIQFLSASCSVSSPSPSSWLSAVHSWNAQKETIRGKPQVETHSWRARLWRRHAYCQVVTEQLHDQGAVFLGIGLKGIQHGDGVIEGLEDTAHTQCFQTVHTHYATSRKSWLEQRHHSALWAKSDTHLKMPVMLTKELQLVPWATSRHSSGNCSAPLQTVHWTLSPESTENKISIFSDYYLQRKKRTDPTVLARLQALSGELTIS